MTYDKLARIARSFGLRDSLLHIWAYSLHVGHGFHLPEDYAHSRPGLARQIRPYVHEFYLDLYVREALLHAGPSKGARRSLQRWDDLRRLHGAIHAYSDLKARCSGDLWITLHRIGHQQLPHFDRFRPAYLGRYWSLYRRGGLSRIVHDALGLTAEDYFLLAAATQTLYMRSHEVPLVPQLAALGLDPSAVAARVHAITGTPSLLRRRCLEVARHDSAWDYTINPIVANPLVRLRADASELLACPRPSLLGKRLLAGLFYDLFSTPGFAQAYGDAFEELAGDCLQQATGAIEAVRPLPYTVRGAVRHGADWILRDGHATLFVECKTMRMPVSAQLAAGPGDLEAGLKRLAKAVVQNCANIRDAMAGHAGIPCADGPVHSLIVTLEDWILFSPASFEALDTLVEAGLADRGLDPTLVQQHPFSVIGCAALPQLVDAMSRHGLAILARKSANRFKRHMFPQFLAEAKLSTESTAATIFDRECEELMGLLRARFQAGT